MAPIISYVFLELKTTGSPTEECNKTRITEISLIAVKRSHILDPLVGSLPRVQLKLSLCLNPGKVIQPQYTEYTGLSNDLLQFESRFKDAFKSIECFINLVSKPVCLVAQDGLNFGFPILKNHMNSLGVTFSDDLLCADYLQAFDDVLKMKDINVFPSDGYINNMIRLENCGVDEIDLFCLTNKLDLQVINETIPKRSDNLNNAAHTSKDGPGTSKICSGHSKAQRLCFWDEEQYDTIPKLKESYKLRNIYERLYKRPSKKAYRAEDDCTVALQCSVAVAREFVRWVDNNHCLFSDVKPMTIGVPLSQ